MDQAPDVFKALDLDWLQLIRHGPTRRRCAVWERTDPTLVGLRTPEAFLHGCQNRSDAAAGNQVMAALLRRQDPTGRRIVLQALIPGIIVRTATIWRRHRHGPWTAIWELHTDAVAHVVEHLAAGGDRPWPAGTALRYMTGGLYDTINASSAAPVPVGDVPDANRPSALATHSTVTSLDALTRELIDQIREGALSVDDAGHVYSYRVLGLSSREIAEATGLSFGASRQRRARAERRVLALLS